MKNLLILMFASVSLMATIWMTLAAPGFSSLA
jgi:hypothetical protein